MNTYTNSNLEAEIAKAHRQAAAKVARLKKAAAEHQSKVDAKVIEYLRDSEPDLHGRLTQKAERALEQDKARRSASARRKASAAGDSSTLAGIRPTVTPAAPEVP